MTIEPRKRISGLEVVFCFWAIDQLKKPIRTVRKGFDCRFCRKPVNPGDDAMGDWHELCVLSLASMIEPGFKAIVDSGKYRVVSEEPNRVVIEPVGRRERQGKAVRP